MTKGKEIICPYCCRKFQPNMVDFRLERALKIPDETEDQEGKEEQVQEEQRPSMMGFVIQKAPVRTKDTKRQSSPDGRVRDEKLFNYYMDYLFQSREDAESNSFLLPAVSVDYMSPDVEYNSRIYSEYGYVTEVTYKGQTLNKRLCPYCHNPVISNAGKYDMMVISVIGDTNVGKSVYLSVLYEMLMQDRKFEGSMLFMGTEIEKEMYLGNMEKLLNKNVLEATDKMKVPPVPFLYTFRTAERQERKSVIVVFCDIPGESCRDLEAIKKHGYHLKVTAGILFLIDPTRFLRIKNDIYFDRDDDSVIGNRHQYEILEVINRYLMDSPDIDKSDIPAAIVLTKSDMLKRLNYFTSDMKHLELLEDMRGADMHPGYLSLKETDRLNAEIQQFLEKMEENRLYNIKDLFHTYNFFLNSALGTAPEFVKMNRDGIEIQEKRVMKVNPYRVTEPFYWLLMKNGYIPCKQVENWRNKKREEKKLEIYYYEGEAATSLENRKKSIRAQNGINEKEVLGFLFGPGWERVSLENA